MVAECLGIHALNSYIRAGGRAWNCETAANLRRALQQDLPAIRSWNPRLAGLYEEGIGIALNAFRDRPEIARAVCVGQALSRRAG